MKAKFLALAALVLGMASCQTDVIDGVKVDANGEAPVTISVGIPEEGTRAAAGADSGIGAINNIDLENEYDIRYILGVYDENDELAKRIVKFEKESISTNFELRLVPGRHYRFVVWADFVTEGSEDALHYNASDLKDIKLTKNMGDNQPMDESRDAYTGIFDTKVDGKVFNSTSRVEITLTRPFAKLRVVTTDMKELYSDLKSATVNYNTPLYTSFNALTAQPEDLESGVVKKVNYATMWYDNEANPRENGTQTLFADYLFGTEDGTVQFILDVTDNTGLDMPEVAFNTSIPVQRNYLTTVQGPILTDPNNITVTIEDDFAQPGIDVEWNEAGTAQELVDILADVAESTTNEETHIVLNGDINLDDLLNLTRASSSASVTIPAGKEVVLDIKDFTITGTDNDTASFGMFNIQPGAKLTIEGRNGKIQLTAKNNRGWNAYSSVISNQRGTFVLNGGTIEHLGGTDMAYGLDILTNTGADDAKATINGGVVKSKTYRAVRLFLNSTKATAELVVNGGTIDGRNNKSIWMQNANTSVNPGKLVVAENADLYGDVMVSGENAPELAIELSVAEAALKNGATVIPSKIPAGYDIYVKNGNWVVEYGVEVNGNEIAVSNAGGLKWIAQQVNSGADYFAGKTVVLTADIDLKGEEWTPIGSAYKDHGFMGNFDGNGKTIKNLTIKNITPDSDGYVYGGLFGVTEGVDTNNQNYIKNLVIENVDIDLDGHIVAAAIAYPYYTDIDDVTVKGNVSIKGGYYTAGVLAYTRRCVDAKNLTIAATNGSIEGDITVGGVISDIQMNGGLTANYFNFSASGLTIKATQNVGGISGIICNQTLNGATVKNVAIECESESKGIIAGSNGGDASKVLDYSYENVTGATRVIGATYGDGLIVVSTADELVAALEAGNGVYLFNDITIDPAKMSNAYGKTGINVKNGQTIDGGNHTLNINGAGGTWDSGINTTGGIIRNLKVTGAFRGIFINHNSDHSEKVVLKNVTTTGTVYTISCDQGKYQGIEATDCKFYGWTSFAKTAGEAKFTNCYFGEGSGNKYCRPYSNTEFVGCTFCPGFTVDTTRATVTFTDCTWEE